MLSIDLHTHTRFFHGYDRIASRFDPYGHAALTTVANRRGLDGVALTNHDYYRPLGDPFEEFLSIPGIEISTTEGHIVVLGPDPPTRTNEGELTPEEAVSLAHERGCVAILAHPFRNSTIRETDIAFDAIECNGKHPRTWRLVREIARERKIPLVGGSDAHYPFEVGRAYTRIDANPTPESIAEAIREGRVEPALSDDPLSRLLRRGYRRVHERKGHFETTPGIGTPPEG